MLAACLCYNVTKLGCKRFDMSSLMLLKYMLSSFMLRYRGHVLALVVTAGSMCMHVYECQACGCTYPQTHAAVFRNSKRKSRVSAWQVCAVLRKTKDDNNDKLTINPPQDPRIKSPRYFECGWQLCARSQAWPRLRLQQTPNVSLIYRIPSICDTTCEFGSPRCAAVPGRCWPSIRFALRPVAVDKRAQNLFAFFHCINSYVRHQILGNYLLEVQFLA
jgi:hypothetical protein